MLRTYQYQNSGLFLKTLTLSPHSSFPVRRNLVSRLETRFFIAGLILVILAGCAAPTASSPTPAAISASPVATRVPLTVTPSQAPTETPSPSPTVTPSGTPTPTVIPSPTLIPPTLPVFTTRLIRTGVLPQAYIANPCEALRLRWSQEGSLPGTVVVPIMFHSIVKDGTTIGNVMDITEQQFKDFVAYASYWGFETVTTAQLTAFLETNAPIPPRAMIMIFDDRRVGVMREHVMPVLEEQGWTATLAYITGPVVTETEWEAVKALAATGRVDVQAHGYLHTGETYFTEFSTDEVIHQEIDNPVTVIESHFGAPPLAFIWPGGNFISRAVTVARQAGYHLGFTINSRGPVLFNWIPLGVEERAMNDPLMVLPRAWSYSATVNLYEAVQIGDLVRADAVQNYASEADYYQTYCGGELPLMPEGLMPTPTP